MPTLDDLRSLEGMTSATLEAGDLIPVFDISSNSVKRLSVADMQSEVLTSPNLGTPNSGTLTNCTVDGTNLIGYRGIPVNPQSAAYTFALTDVGKMVYHPPADTTARTWTIPAQASVNFPIGSVIVIDNDYLAGVLTIQITTDTLSLVGEAGDTGSMYLASGESATLVKVASARWRIKGATALA